jgi:hypothetical protein
VDEKARREFAERSVQILDRGLLNSRLDVQGVPDDIHGEWISNDTESIFRAKSLGFEIDETYAVGSAMHSDGTGKPIVGDAIFVTMPKWKKEIIDKQKATLVQRVHNKGSSLREEQEFDAQGLERVNESKINRVGANDINAAIEAAQTEATKNTE